MSRHHPHDLQLMAQRAMQAKARGFGHPEHTRYVQLVARLSTRLGLHNEDVEARIQLLAMGIPS